MLVTNFSSTRFKWLLNTARVCDRDTVTCRCGAEERLTLWLRKGCPWRMVNSLGGGNGVVPHYSGTTLDAQVRYAAGTRELLENCLIGRPKDRVPARHCRPRKVRNKGIRSTLSIYGQGDQGS
ncbi:uncharacterized protein LAESUDRAFT_370468 [Laetiporus sulphureus 93-53]|uniref:D-isomer specific 2-hydroxyacid dehydrogenase NAD-binding domain-containing protein n=1 Tax=Laetiporus sulphureus 93-53 TaxID=1314785 RepID=A0A165CQP3_9APHY|nr:uncharacterized protein LAESUDRAFT_370468 [Laetiporus sulphureus 93-53]KZT03248.1 hypothetical protein LAESUDRAFT_370468 [Laetiporus sulphureus 93-53]